MRIFAGRWQEAQHDVFCHRKPRVVRTRAPDNVCHATAGAQSLAHIAEAGDWIGEEHCAEAGKNEIELISRQRNLGVTAYKTDVGQTQRRYLPACIFEEGVAAVDTGHTPIRPDKRSQLDGSVAKTTAYIKHTIPWMYLGALGRSPHYVCSNRQRGRA